MISTATPMEEFCASLECIVEEASDAGLSFAEMVGALTIKAQEVSLACVAAMDEDDEDEEEEGEHL
jgi:hypothetical protein